MFRRISMIAAIALVSICTTHVAHAQFGGLRVQFGGYGYGNGVRVTSYGNGYGNRYGSPYYGNRYNGMANGGYYNNSPVYSGLYPNFGSTYVAPYYYAPSRPYAGRRYRFR